MNALVALAWKYRVGLGKVVVVAGALTAAYARVYSRGYQKAETKYLHEIQVTEEHNTLAVMKANQAADARTSILNQKIKDLQNVLASNGAQRALDPTGAESGLSRDGVRRLNRIK